MSDNFISNWSFIRLVAQFAFPSMIVRLQLSRFAATAPAMLKHPGELSRRKDSTKTVAERTDTRCGAAGRLKDRGSLDSPALSPGNRGLNHAGCSRRWHGTKRISTRRSTAAAIRLSMANDGAFDVGRRYDEWRHQSVHKWAWNRPRTELGCNHEPLDQHLD